jgi:hypothetical protein
MTEIFGCGLACLRWVFHAQSDSPGSYRSAIVPAPHAAGWMIHSSTRVTRRLDEQLSTSMAKYSRVKLSAILSYAQRTARCQAVHHDVHRPFFIGLLELGDASPPDSHHDTARFTS